MKTIKMSRRGMLEIPLDIWEKIGVKPGDTIEMSVSEGVIHIEKVRGELNNQMGSVEAESPQDFGQIRKDLLKMRGK